MPDTFKIVKARNDGERDNPHGGKLVKWQVILWNSPSGEEEVFIQKKPGNDLSEGMEITGRLKKEEYGWRLYPDAQQGGSSPQPRGNGRGGFTSPDPDRSRRIERQHSQEMALRALSDSRHSEDPGIFRGEIREWTNWFVNDLDVDVGGGSGGSASGGHTAADVSVETGASGGSGSEIAPTGLSGGEMGASTSVDPAGPSPEASPQQKGRLTQEFNKAGFSRDAMKAVVLYRCKSEKATKQGASQLITDLNEGATLEQLLAEIYDAKRAGNPLAIRAAALIPSEVPGDAEGLPELNPEDKSKYGAEEGSVPF